MADSTTAAGLNKEKSFKPQAERRKAIITKWFNGVNTVEELRRRYKEFYVLIYELYGIRRAKQLDYEQMYRLIYILNHWKLLDKGRTGK